MDLNQIDAGVAAKWELCKYVILYGSKPVRHPCGLLDGLCKYVILYGSKPQAKAEQRPCMLCKYVILYKSKPSNLHTLLCTILHTL